LAGREEYRREGREEEERRINGRTPSTISIAITNSEFEWSFLAYPFIIQHYIIHIYRSSYATPYTTSHRYWDCQSWTPQSCIHNRSEHTSYHIALIFLRLSHFHTYPTPLSTTNDSRNANNTCKIDAHASAIREILSR
jgi:hypothetical protein